MVSVPRGSGGEVNAVLGCGRPKEHRDRGSNLRRRRRTRRLGGRRHHRCVGSGSAELGFREEVRPTHDGWGYEGKATSIRAEQHNTRAEGSFQFQRRLWLAFLRVAAGKWMRCLDAGVLRSVGTVATVVVVEGSAGRIGGMSDHRVGARASRGRRQAGAW